MAASRSTDESLDITLSALTVGAAIGLLQQERNRRVRNVVITFEGISGRNANPADRTDLLLQQDFSMVFSTMAQSLPNLEHLRMEWNILSAHFREEPPLIPLEILRILIAETPLQSLTLYRMQLAGNERDYEILTQPIRDNKTLHTLRLEFCKPVGCPNLDPAVITLSKLPHVKEFEVIGLPDDATRVCSATALEAVGRNCAKLRCLKLWGGIWQVESHNALTGLVEGLKSPTCTVQDLEVGLFQMDVSSSQILADLLRSNTSIERIWLDANTPITKETVAPLTQAMMQGNTITNFNLISTAAIRDAPPRPEIGCRAYQQRQQVLRCFVDMLKVNQTLRHCTVRTGRDDPEPSILQQTMNLYLRLNRVDRKQLLGKGISDHYQWLLALACEQDHTSVVFYLLSRNPNFICQCVASNKRKRLPAVVSPEQEGEPTRKRQRLIDYPTDYPMPSFMPSKFAYLPLPPPRDGSTL